MEEDFSQITEARRIAIEAGVIARCEWHPDIILYQFTDDARAYQFANAQYNKGELEDVFGSRQELNDAIKDVIEDVVVDGCPACQKLLE